MRRIDDIPTFVCEHCGETVERKRVIRRGHSRGFLRGIRFCSRRCANLARGSKGFIHKRTGYRMISLGSRAAGVREEHRVVMEKILGRPLRADETVHHKNGVRTDNRPENLELWSGRHGKGHRVADQIVFAKETLAIYGDLDARLDQQRRAELVDDALSLWL